MKNDAEQKRMETKLEMVYERGGQLCACDRCGEFHGSQMHELIHRSKTSRDSAARELTYQKELCAILCVHCHSAIHDHGVDETELWLKNYRRYTHDAVLKAFKRVEGAMKSKLGIVLPEPMEDHHE